MLKDNEIQKQCMWKCDASLHPKCIWIAIKEDRTNNLLNKQSAGTNSSAPTAALMSTDYITLFRGHGYVLFQMAQDKARTRIRQEGTEMDFCRKTFGSSSKFKL